MKDALNGTTRRAFLQGTTAALAVPLILTARQVTARQGEAETLPPVPVVPPSPPTTPWQEALPDAITPLAPVSALTPAPTVAPNLAAGECGRAAHQRFAELGQAPTLYEMAAKENPAWVFNPAYPPQPIWGFTGTTPDATTPGPTLVARYGHPILCRIHNQLPYEHVGFGTPEITTHLHNLHTPSESDGFPGDSYGPHPEPQAPRVVGPRARAVALASRHGDTRVVSTYGTVPIASPGP